MNEDGNETRPEEEAREKKYKNGEMKGKGKY